MDDRVLEDEGGFVVGAMVGDDDGIGVIGFGVLRGGIGR